MALELNSGNFADVIKNNEVVLVDFWAPWCGPCRMIAPIIEELSEDYSENNKVAIAKVNTDEAGEIAAQFGIRSIPTVIFFKNGEVADSMVGAAPKQIYVEKINALLS